MSRRRRRVRILPNPTPHQAVERRITGRVVAHPLTGQPEPWLEVEGFECAADEFRAQMRAVADSWSTRRAGDVLAFRVRPRVDGVGSFYWYLSPAKGPMPVPSAGLNNLWTTTTSRTSDWLTAWSVENYPPTLFEHLGKINETLAFDLLRKAFDRAVCAVAENPHVLSAPERNLGTVRWLKQTGVAPRSLRDERPSHAVALLGLVATEFEDYLPQGDYTWSAPRDDRVPYSPYSPGTWGWRRGLARNVLDAITKSGALLAQGKVHDVPEWRDGGAWANALYAMRREVSSWVRERVSLDMLASRRAPFAP